jgi:hypothetical protein
VLVRHDWLFLAKVVEARKPRVVDPGANPPSNEIPVVTGTAAKRV